MNMHPYRTAAFALLLVTALSACSKRSGEATTATVVPDAAPAAVEAAPPPPAAAPTNQAEAAAQAIPDTADAIWVEIDKHQAELRDTIANGDLKEVHHHAFAIRDLVAALPTHSPQGTAEEQAKLKNDVQFVATLAERLDTAGDAGDKAGAQAGFEQLSSVLTGITRTK